MKKLLSLFLAIALLSILMVSCSSTTASESPADAPTTEDAASTDDDGAAAGTPSELDLYIYYVDAGKVGTDAALAKMTEQYPDLTVNIEHRTDKLADYMSIKLATYLPHYVRCISK